VDPTAPAATFDRAAPTYDRVGVDFFRAFGERLVHFADLEPGQSVLDVGTGRGAVLRPAAAAVGPTGRAVGVDLAPTMVALTAADLADAFHVEVRQADATALPDDLGQFDAVLSSLVLFFTPHPEGTLRHWASFVRRNGRLGLTTFLPDDDDEMIRDLLRPHLPPAEPPTGPDPFELVSDPAWLDDALQAAGLPVIDADAYRYPVRFTDADQWWAWLWSHGARAALEQLDADQQRQVREDGAALLDRRRLPDGGLGLHVTVRFTTARR
jgi:ubiquinone/menaquinone biosynthesis C-methylase UbiE